MGKQSRLRKARKVIREYEPQIKAAEFREQLAKSIAPVKQNR